MKTIAVYSTATVVSREEVQKMVAACSAQLAEDFCPAWDMTPICVEFYAAKAGIPKGTPTILIADECDDAEALAYHTEGLDGAITGLVGAKTCLDAGESVCSALSHEILETAADAQINLWADMPNVNGHRKVAREVCDPVQDQTYERSGETVSNFVTPAWFDESPPAGSKFDFLGSLRRPFARTEGGYMVLDVGGGRTMQEGMRAAHKPKASSSRAARRCAA